MPLWVFAVGWAGTAAPGAATDTSLPLGHSAGMLMWGMWGAKGWHPAGRPAQCGVLEQWVLVLLPHTGLASCQKSSDHSWISW